MSLDKQQWLIAERERCIGIGAWRRATCRDNVSACHLVPKPGKSKYREVIDFRHLNSYMTEKGCR